MQKIFIVDTNVILYDTLCLNNFQDNNIILPITVLEELDKLKTGTDTTNFQAREFIRKLDELISGKFPKDGISLGSGKGKLYIVSGKYSENVYNSFPEKTPDHRILAITDWIKQEQLTTWSFGKAGANVILITKDINLRLKAKSLGIDAEDYETGKVLDTEVFGKKTRTLEKLDDALISTLFTDGFIPLNKIKIKKKPISNEYFIFKGTTNNALVKFDKNLNSFVKIEKRKVYGIEPRNAEQTFSVDALLDPNIQLVSLTGKPGSGKTLIALAAALHQKKDYTQILLARPIVPLSNNSLGFLPGDVNEKIGPYMIPLFDNLSVIKHSFSETSKERKNIEDMLAAEKLLITPLAYIRGRSLSRVFFIIDEAQNLTPHEVKTIITRAGEGTKLVFTGDIQQIDSPWLDSQSNGLSNFTDKFLGQNVFAHINLIKGERSYLADLASELL